MGTKDGCWNTLPGKIYPGKISTSHSQAARAWPDRQIREGDNHLEKTIQYIVKYSLGGMLYLWWRPANLILSYLYDDEVKEEKTTKKTYTRREFLTLAFLPILK